MYEYYLKKCGNQELGSVSSNGVPQRGRYLLTSMKEEVLSFFPPLTTQQLNDSALLPIIPLYSGKKIYCNYVYHNDKFHGSTAAHPRNEYRIYLNKSLEGDTLRFIASDICVFRKQELMEDGVSQTVYLMDLVHPGTDYYNYLNTIVESYPINGGYGMLKGMLNEFETKAERVLDVDTPETIIDVTITERIIKTPVTEVAELFNAATFRDFVMTGYGNKCAITGNVIQYESYMNLEAAHIKPRSHGGLFMPNNGLALCRDMHWAFDKGFFTLNDRLEVQVHPDIHSDFLNQYNGKSIRIPTDTFFKPDLNNVRYHQESVYGLFLTSGRL